jgi:hypothetical protein
MLRAAIVALSLICLGLGLNLLLDWSISLPLLIGIAVVCLLIGGISILTDRMSVDEAARRLDQRFGLNQQLATALEVNRTEAPEGVALRLVEQATTTAGQVSQYVSQNRRPPWMDVLAVAAMLVLALGLFALLSIQPFAGMPATEPLPPLSAAPDVAQQQQSADPENQPPPPDTPGVGGEQQQQTVAAAALDQQSAAALADALRDQSATRPAADALDQGDVAGAAERLRELADQAENLSEDTRQGLAQQLRDAASDIEMNNADMAADVRDSAYGLQQEQTSAEALERLADAIEQLDDGGTEQQAQAEQQGEASGAEDNQQPQGGGAGGGDVGSAPPPSEQREQSHERLGVDGVPLELESQGGGNLPSEGEPETSAPGGSSFEAGESTVTDETVQVGDDPLRIPAELRDVVQEYFSPTE